MQVPEDKAITFFFIKWVKFRLRGPEFYQTIVTLKPFHPPATVCRNPFLLLPEIPMAGCLVPSIWGHFGPEFGFGKVLPGFVPTLGFLANIAC